MSTESRLCDEIRQRTATVGVIGLGYVGLPFAVEKAKTGFSVVGIEKRRQVEQVNQAGSRIIYDDLACAELRQAANSD